MSTTSERLAIYLAAERAILTGGETVRLGDRLLTQAPLSEIRAEITLLRGQLAAEQRLAAGGSATRYAVADFS